MDCAVGRHSRYVGSTVSGTPDTRSLVERLTPFIVAGVLVAAFQIAFRFGRPSVVWPAGIVLILAGTAIAMWFDQRGLSARTPYPFALMAIVPALLIAGISQLGTTARWPWLVTTLVALVVGLISVIPMWFAGCYLAAAFGVPGCHF